MFKDATEEEVNEIMELAHAAFSIYRKTSLAQRAAFMRTIATELEACGDALIQTAMEETHLPEARLRNERGRTILQLNQYATACEKGGWLDIRIDTAIPDKNPPRPDIRKMLVPLGPVVVFGASNFPFAYSTAGGDTACAFAAGCPVIVKAHPAHAHTSQMVADAIDRAVKQCGLPDGVFAHVYGISFEVGKQLVTHQHTKAAGFTGSFGGGKQLFDWANQRETPIPVFAEMGSTNPVFLLPEKLSMDAVDMAVAYAGSVTLGVGQFCTKPGLIIGIESEGLNLFISELGTLIHTLPPLNMLHEGIASAYKKNKTEALAQSHLQLVAEVETATTTLQGTPAIATVPATAFLNNPVLHQEVFGPYSLVIRCKDMEEMVAVAKSMHGQLTATLMATENEVGAYPSLTDAVLDICGRFILNGVPTGVEVCHSMHHGGPFPATTDSRFTSVGADGIKRFARPITFQNWPKNLLPVELKNENPLGIWRMVNDEWGNGAV
jgi:2,5-dioxopentanoate dehydrogenase